MKRLSILSLLVLAAGCQFIQPDVNIDEEPVPIRIDPIITKANDVNFEDGDKIGLTVTTEEGEYANNALLTYSERLFRGELCWYLEPERTCTLNAYYPYQEGGLGDRFSVQLDQSEGIGGSDLMRGSKKNVRPAYDGSVNVIFQHQLSKVTITTANMSGVDLSSVRILDAYQTAKLDAEKNVFLADSTLEKTGIKTHNTVRDTTWEVILVPQKAAFQLEVTLSDGKVLTQKLAEVELASNTRFSISAVVYNNNIKIITSGQIMPWLEGGDILGLDEPVPEEKDFEEFEDHFVYFGQSYKIVTLKDGNKWMAENLRYVPEGKTASMDPDEEGDGIWYPAPNAELLADPSLVATKGYLYTTDAALGVAITADNAVSLEGAQGICPEGWHIPTNTELVGLVGHHSNSAMINSAAPYYDSLIKGADIDKINADGFNWTFVGIRQKNTYSATGKYTANVYEGTYGTMSFLAGSTFCRISTSSETGEELNIQFYGMMSTYNASNHKLSVAQLNKTNGVSVRCIKTKTD